MSMNINKPKGGKGAMAPTPNNTPNLSAPIQKGNKNEHPAEAKGSLAGAISDKLASMSVEEEGGFYDSLPKEIKRRVFALENIQSKHAELEFQFREEVLALEAKYLGLYKPLYQRRSEIINGKVEPTDEEAKNPEGAEEEPEEKPAEKGGKGKKGKQGKAESPAPTIQGIPEFWLTALRTHPLISTMITENDEPLLAALNDIRLSYIDNNHGFVIEFEFADNEFFTNKTLTKTYYLENSADQGYDDLVYSRSEGCTIDWKQGKNLTVKVETKKQRHKGTKKTRVVKKLVPQETFFNFFKTPAVPTENEDEEDEDEEEGAGGLEDALETDFEMGEILKTKIIPHAIDWFTGKALEYDDYFDQYDEEEDGEDYDDEEDDEDDDDDDVPAGATGGKSEKPAECNQQ